LPVRGEVESPLDGDDPFPADDGEPPDWFAPPIGVRLESDGDAAPLCGPAFHLPNSDCDR
jgi:hypothetical protein